MDLISRWNVYGDTFIVGSVALDLVVRPDIDLEIFSDTASARDGFTIMRDLADLPKIRGVGFNNDRHAPAAGLYWKLKYELTADQVWTVDMWLFDRPRLPRSATANVEPLRRALTDETRDTILAIKEEAAACSSRAHGHWLYRAVLNEGVRTYAEYTAWIGDQDVWERTSWQSNPPKDQGRS